MNGVIDGDMVLNAAIHHPEVRDLCLNCRHARCVNVGDGCAEYREAVKKCTRVYKRSVKSDGEMGGSGRAHAAGMVGGV